MTQQLVAFETVFENMKLEGNWNAAEIGVLNVNIARNLFPSCKSICLGFFVGNPLLQYISLSSTSVFEPRCSRDLLERQVSSLSDLVHLSRKLPSFVHVSTVISRSIVINYHVGTAFRVAI